MSEFEYIECPEGQEQGPAIEDTAPYCVPADEANPGAPVLEVGLLIYKKLDATLPASWPNSGEQTFIAAQPGTDWFTVFPGELPAHVCGDGWAIQQDAIEHDGSFVWPETIEYPHDNIGWPPIYDAQHTDLEMYIDVPECVQVTPSPTPVPVEPELAATGGEWLLIAAIAASLLAIGLAFLAAASMSRRPRCKRK